MGYRVYKACDIIWGKSFCQLMIWLHCYDHNNRFGHIGKRRQLLSYLWVPVLMILAKKLEGYHFYENYMIISYSTVEFSTGALREMLESVCVSITTTLSKDISICNMCRCVWFSVPYCSRHIHCPAHETAGIMNQFRNVVYQKGHGLVKQTAFGGGGLNPWGILLFCSCSTICDTCGGYQAVWCLDGSA